MKILTFLSLFAAGSALAASADRSRIQSIKVVDVPYRITIHTDKTEPSRLASCSLEYKGIVLANRQTKGHGQFDFKGTFKLRSDVTAVQLRCQVDGYQPIAESVKLENNELKVETCCSTANLFQEPQVDLEQGIARVQLKIPTFRQQKLWIDGKSFVRLTSDHNDIVSNSYSGQPMLAEFPMTHFFFALPLDAEVTGITVKKGPIIDSLNLPLVPKADPRPTEFKVEIPPRFDREIYFSDANEISPEVDTQLQAIVNRTQNFVKVSMPLVEFSARKEVIHFFEDMEILVSFKSRSACFRVPFHGGDAVDAYRSRQLTGLNHLILNPQDVLSSCRQESITGDIIRSRPQLMMTRDAMGLGPNLLIVAPAEFMSEAENLRLHKETLGIRTEILEWDGNDSSDLKSILDKKAKELLPHKLQWVLLLGDVDRIPTYYDHDIGDPEYNDFALTAGDVYYTQFAVDANSYKSSLDPQSSIGRIPAKTLDELHQVIARTINFERNPPTVNTYYDTPTITASMQTKMTPGGQVIGIANNDSEYIENTFSNPYFQAGFRPERIYRTETQEVVKPSEWSQGKPIDYNSLERMDPNLTPSQLFHMDGSQDQIDRALQRGTNLLVYHGHGETLKWGKPEYLYDPKRFSLFPADRPPVVFAVTCLTGFFDSETIQSRQGDQYLYITHNRSKFKRVDPNGRFMAEQWLLDPYGALGVVAASRQSQIPFNQRMITGLARSLIDRQTPKGIPLSQHIGNVMVDAKVYAKANGGALTSTRAQEIEDGHHLLVYNLLGDPSVEIRHWEPLRVVDKPTVFYDAETATLRIRFKVESLASPGHPLNEQKDQHIAVLMDADNQVIDRALATYIVSESGENREIVLTRVTSFYGNVLYVHLSNAGLIPYTYVIDNRIR